MSSPAAQRVACAPASQPVLPEEILEEIFLRLDAAEDLARASAACTTFHRVVTARRFARRFRCLHPVPILGVIEFEVDARTAFRPAEPPHRSAPAARAAAKAADFNFSFLGTPPCWTQCWNVCDARDGRVLLYRGIKLNLMVCDPLHRRHVQLPPVPNHLLAATPMQYGVLDLDPFLDSATDTENQQQDLPFRVFCAVQRRYNLVTFHFSSVTGQWRGITFNRPVPLAPSAIFQMFGRRHYAHGCFFWTIAGYIGGMFMIMLNMHDMKLSVVDLPPGRHWNPHTWAIIEAGEGMIGLFTLSDGMLQLYHKSLRGTEWHQERIIPLPEPNSNWRILDAAAGYLLLEETPRDSPLLAGQRSQYFTLNLKTFLVERLCVSYKNIRGAHLYASFLPPISLPSI